MGFLGSIRKKVVNTPLRRMNNKRKRSGGEITLKFASTSEFTDDSSVIESVDSSSYEHTRRLSLRQTAQSEDTQELLSPHDDSDGSFVFDPIMISDDDTTDDENPRSDAMYDAQQDTFMNNDDNCLLDVDMDDGAMAYVSDDSADCDLSQAEPACHVSLIRSHTPPNAPTHSRKRSDGQQQVMHLFHDELATLYEEPNKSSESSMKSASSIEETSVVRLRDTSLDESNIRARWEYALKLMVGQCEPSELLYNSLAEMMTITNGEDADMEVAEI